MDFVPHEDQAGKFEHRVLGINWHLTDDTLSVPGPSVYNNGCVWTKRKVLQVISSVFDLLGYFSPTVLEAKLLLKTFWMEKCEWDAELNGVQLEMWLQIFEALKNIPLCRLSRYTGISSDESDSVDYSLVCFCDALAKAYATAIYLHQSFTSSCKVDLIFSKTRLAPQNMTIPRLELLGVLVAERTLKFVLSELYFHVTSTVVISDSMYELHWIKSQKPLSLFVTNGLKEIRSVEGLKLKHVSSEDNPADLATRGKRS